MEWDLFLREAENAAWMGFPERIIGQVEVEDLEDDNGIARIQKSSVNGVSGNGRWFCH